jgi:methylglyoxal synthase
MALGFGRKNDDFRCMMDKDMKVPARIALIAHDGKKAALQSFVKKNLSFFQEFRLVATGTTGQQIADLGLEVERLASGPLGGDAQIAAQITEGDVHAVIFFRDPMGKHPHEPDINMLLRQCDVHDIPLATNAASADSLIYGLKGWLASKATLN